MASLRLVLVSTAVLLSLAACSGGHYNNRIPGSYGAYYKSGSQAAKAKDYETAAEHYAFAAKSGHPRAVTAYAELFAYGRGVDRDPLKAVALLENAYGKSSSAKGKTALTLGRVLLEGGSGPSGEFAANPERARALLTEALTSGQVNAASSLGKIYDKGIGTERDIAKAISYYQRVAGRSPSGARRHAELLAEAGAPKARIAEAADNAITLIEERAEGGSSKAWVQLADIYTRGTIIEPDYERAIGYLEKVVGEGDTAVYMRLVRLYGKIGDDQREREMLQLAADADDVKAQTKLARLFLKAGTADTNGPVGRYYAERAIGKGNTSAMVYLGAALIRGDVLTADPQTGETLLRRASEVGHVSGKSALGAAILRGKITGRSAD
ncbi:MAG: tetratricopeptide repeat protein, partial [Geminicoccaceae bacterium]